MNVHTHVIFLPISLTSHHKTLQILKPCWNSKPIDQYSIIRLTNKEINLTVKNPSVFFFSSKSVLEFHFWFKINIACSALHCNKLILSSKWTNKFFTQEKKQSTWQNVNLIDLCWVIDIWNWIWMFCTKPTIDYVQWDYLPLKDLWVRLCKYIDIADYLSISFEILYP